MEKEIKTNSVGLEELFGLFEESITGSDIIAARLLSKISATIAQKRLALNMTQKEFADYLCVSQSMVSKWESMDYNFSIKALADIACRLDLELDISMESSKSDSHTQHLKQAGISIAEYERNQYSGKQSNIVSFATNNNVTASPKRI